MATLGFQGTALIDLEQPVGRRIRWLPRPEGGQEVFAAGSWSPDGRRLAGTLERNGSAVPGAVVFAFDSGRYERVTRTGLVPIWMNDSRRLLYRDEGKIFLCDLRTRASRLLLAPPQSSSYIALAVGPGDRSLYMVRETDEGDVWMLTLKNEVQR